LTIALTNGNPTAIPTTAGGAPAFHLPGQVSVGGGVLADYLYHRFPRGKVPKPVNDLIGTIAAMEILSQLAQRTAIFGVEFEHDGGSQSVSTPGPEIFTRRMQDLQIKA